MAASRTIPLAGSLLATILLACCSGGSGGAGGSTPAAPAISYGPSGSKLTQFTFAANSAVALTAHNSGEPVTSWSVSPPLPVGLAFDSSTGAISGTPDSFAPTSVTVTATNAGSSSQVTASSGGPVLWSGTGVPLLSLDDSFIAASGSTGTLIYSNDVESATIAGSGVGWLQNDDLLVSTSNASAIFDSGGIKQSGPTLPPLFGPIQVLSSSAIFDTHTIAIYSLSSGAKTWSTSNAEAAGAVAGTVVVFPNYLNQLVTEPY